MQFLDGHLLLSASDLINHLECEHLKHSERDQAYESALPEPLIETSASSGDFPSAEGVELMAGTAWLWCREDMRESVDYLIVDEAGQASLADALALVSAARNVILLGDPLQLAQVSTGAHPPGSVLEHLRGVPLLAQPAQCRGLSRPLHRSAGGEPAD